MRSACRTWIRSPPKSLKCFVSDDLPEPAGPARPITHGLPLGLSFLLGGDLSNGRPSNPRREVDELIFESTRTRGRVESSLLQRK